EPLEVLHLEGFVAPDLVRQFRDGHGPIMGLGTEARQRRLDQAPILTDERPLDAPDLGVPEDVERGAAKPAEPPERLERRCEPGAELQLLLEPERAEERWMQV